MLVYTNEDVQDRAEELHAKAERARSESKEMKVFLFWLAAFAIVAKILK